jgi:hypothetical protein
MQRARLKNWILCDFGPSKHLIGEVYGHTAFQDGRKVCTSAVQWMDERLGLAKTLNTLYELKDLPEGPDNRVPAAEMMQ